MKPPITIIKIDVPNLRRKRQILIQIRKARVRQPCQCFECVHNCTYFNKPRPEDKAIEPKQFYYEVKIVIFNLKGFPDGTYSVTKVCSNECLKKTLQKKYNHLLKTEEEGKDYLNALDKLKDLVEDEK